ncbi:glycosyltransferase [Microbacterium sp. NPDC003461]
MTDGHRPKVLILSFSRVATDPRVVRQISVLKDRYEIITCGYGEVPHGVEHHVELPEEARAYVWDGRVLALRQYRYALWTNAAVRAALKGLRGVRPDIVLANEAIAVPVALKLRPSLGVHADLHEYHSRVRENEGYWNKRARPWTEWMIRTYVRRADSWTTVGPGIAAEYEREFGFRPDVARNVAPYIDAEPRPSSWPPRLVHSGGAMRKRAIHVMAEGVLAARNGATLDLYLVPSEPKYVDELRLLAERSDGRITLHDPVPYRELMKRLQEYDLGIHVLPPINFNHRMALPNKVFDYLQARIGAVVGPSPEMVELVESTGYGVSTRDFTAQSIAETIDGLTGSQIDEMKRCAHANARDLSAELENTVWLRAIEELERRHADR